MPRRQPLPRIWLMTDERLGDALWGILIALPRGSGVIFRHYTMPAAERRPLYERVRAIARRRGLILVLAGGLRDAIGWRADGAHGRGRHVRAARPLLRTAPAHGRADLHAGAGKDLLLLSPVFATRSHPGAPTLGVTRFGLAARHATVPVVALGGVDARRFRRLRALGAYGWAGIDAFGRPPG